jgi:hypothetical protein
VRRRIDWKYVLRLELTYPGFDASLLSECRTRLIAGAAESLLFDMLLIWCRDRQLVKARGRQRIDSPPYSGGGAGPEPPRGRWRHAAACPAYARGRRAGVVTRREPSRLAEPLCTTG